jgi:hypothetical protein
MYGKRSRSAAWLAAMMLAMACSRSRVDAADHRDGTIFPNTYLNGALDINDLYIFRAPNNANNTVLIMTLAPFAGASTPPFFRHEKTRFEVVVDNTGDLKPDLTFSVTFDPPDALGLQQVRLSGLPKRAFPAGNVLAEGATNTNLPVAGGGMFRAGIFDDPFFFDANGFAALLNGGSFPRPVGVASNFFGPNVNTLGIVLEIPTASIEDAAGVPDIDFHARIMQGSKQVDRMGRPSISTALIPPVPRGSSFPSAGPELRDAFNAGKPARDVGKFSEPMIDVLTSFYGRTSADAATLTNFLLPDVLPYNPATASGFPNGRRLRDDVIDIELALLTNGALTTDNVGDDNGSRITDGGAATTAAFPYIGARNPCPPGVPGGL